MKEIFISTATGDHQAAITQNELLENFFSESPNSASLVGNIYHGTVVRVLPGMESAFVDIGLERTAFLHVNNIKQPQAQDKPLSISQFLIQGQQILVQVIKDPIGTKGARLTTELSLASTFLVYMPFEHGVGVSSRLNNDPERQRLKEILEQLPLKGLIARTAAEGLTLETLQKDCDYLAKRWKYAQSLVQSDQSNKLVLQELPLPLRLLRDFAKYPVKSIYYDDALLYQQAQVFIEDFLPDFEAQIVLEDQNKFLFSRYNILDQWQAALCRKLSLKSGGSVIIEQTESMTTIDVNTAGYVGKKNHDDTIYKTNYEAAKVIAHQIKLRNIGGLIVIDFIDMADENHRNSIYDAFVKFLDGDMMPILVLPISELGLIEMTRKRMTESLDHRFHQTCSSCKGLGKIKTPEALAIEILSQIFTMREIYAGRRLMILSNVNIIEALEDRRPAIEQRLKKYDLKLSWKIEHGVPWNYYDIIPLKENLTLS